MIGIKDQCFGVEVEFTGITREQAAKALAGYFGTTPHHKGGAYDTTRRWQITSNSGRQPVAIWIRFEVKARPRNTASS